MTHKCDGCKFKGEHQEMGFRPFGVCTKEPHLGDAVSAFNAEVCPYKKKDQMTEAEIMRALKKQRDKVVANEVFVFEVIALINRKNAEIDELQHEKTELQHEIEKLNFENLQMVASIKGLKAEAIKSYSAELLGKYCRYDEDGNGFVCDTDIYNLARHMEVEK